MTIELNSFASSLMYGTILYRNRNGFWGGVTAQLAFPCIALIAAIESVVAVIFSALALLTQFLPNYYNLNMRNYITWLGSSSFTLIWAVGDFVLNPVCGRMVADEKSIRQILNSGDVFAIPAGAVV